MTPTPLYPPRVTIVVCERERHSLAPAVIDTIVAHTPRPYRFLYLDTHSPAWLREELDRRADACGLEIVRFDAPLWPHEARQRIAHRIDTEYAVFIDNDIAVEEGWLERLVACADETGAGVVGPLYLWGDGVGAPKIHMAGGKLDEAPDQGGRVLAEAHLLVNELPDNVALRLARGPCDFVEYHCMLVRAELLRDGSLIDPSIRCVHEHIDTALTAKERGYPVYFEPSARVVYLAFAEYLLDDLPLFRWRWSIPEAEASIAAFCRKWQVLNDNRSFKGVRQFLDHNNGRIDPVRLGFRDTSAARAVMQREELRQTRSDLLDFAVLQGYEGNDLVLIANAYHLAHVMMDGGYRPCGRPFINHLTGTASVLVRYGFRAETVAAALLHSAYSHCPHGQEDPATALEAVSRVLGGNGSDMEKRVRAYTRRSATWSKLPPAGLAPPRLSLIEAEALAIAAANEVDMHLSGEFRYSGRGDALPAEAMRQIEYVCRVLGVAGLYETLAEAVRQQQAVPSHLVTRTRESYRIGADKRHAVRMVSMPQAALAQLRP